MDFKWMKEHAVKISVGLIVIVILLMFAVPKICDRASFVAKSPVCAGESCRASGMGIASKSTAPLAAMVSRMQLAKQKLIK